MVLLVIRHPCNMNRSTAGWNSSAESFNHAPKGTSSRTWPQYTQYAMRPSRKRDVGIGVPSKNLLLPVASLGSTETVTLKRARRVRPHSTKKASPTVSRVDRKPIVNATMAGATPNEIYMNEGVSKPCASIAMESCIALQTKRQSEIAPNRLENPALDP